MNAKVYSLGLMAASVLMVFCGSASADRPTWPAGTVYTGPTHSKSIGHVTIHGSNGWTKECQGTAEEEIISHGPGKPVVAAINSWSFTPCTNEFVSHVRKSGTTTFHAVGGGSATVTSTGVEWEETGKTIFGTITCIYATSNTDMGTLTGSESTGGAAIMDINATVPRTGGSALCGSTGLLTGIWKVINPPGLVIDPS